MKKSSMFPGLLLIAFGVMLLANNMGLFVFNFEYLWPLFLLVPGLVFELSYFATGRNAGTLVPGGILTLYGLFFYFNIVTGWNLMDSLWPVFILGPAIGLFQLYLFGGRDNGVLISSTILFVISMTFFTFTLFGFAAEYFAPAALILIGFFVLFKGRRESNPPNTYSNKSRNDDLEDYYDTDDE